MINTYTNNNISIVLNKLNDSVIIHLSDIETSNTYSNTFVETTIIDYCYNIETFYSVLKTSFEAFENIDDSKAKVDITINNLNAIIAINHKYYINFVFELELKLETTNCDLMQIKKIKDLENKLNNANLLIEQLTNKINDLEKNQPCITNEINNSCINNLIKVVDFVVLNSDNRFYYLDPDAPYNENITLNYTDLYTPDMSTTINFHFGVTLALDPCSFINENFSKIKCKRLTIKLDNYINYQQFKNIPVSIETLELDRDCCHNGNFDVNKLLDLMTLREWDNLTRIKIGNNTQGITIIDIPINMMKKLNQIEFIGSHNFICKNKDILLSKGIKIEHKTR